jgi:hypothetical protein
MLTNTANYTSFQKHVPATPIINEFSAFVQDEWHVVPPLTLSMGLRWELNPPPTEANGKTLYTLRGDVNNPATLSLTPAGTPAWKTSWYNFAPRLGLAWVAHTIPGKELVVRVGGGAFYDTGNQVAANGYAASAGFFASNITYGTPLPISASQVAFSTDPIAPYTATNIYAFPEHLQLPYSLQWNASLTQAFSQDQSLTISYVASSGRRLLQQQSRYVNALNSQFGYISYFPNGATSSYQSLQLKYQRSVSHGLQALVSYTWSHSLDYGSTNSSLPLTYGNSDFDVRHNFQGGLTWEMPRYQGSKLAADVLNGWAIDGRLNIRTAFPISLTGALLTDAVGNRYYGNVNYDPSRPIYRYGSQYPGGRVINGGANNTATPAFSIPITGSTGTAPRNFVRGFGANQINVAIRREFKLHEGLNLQFRAESFNVLNHPNFGYVNPTLSNALFGQATSMLNQSLSTMSSLYQQGGPRSSQFALKVQF